MSKQLEMIAAVYADEDRANVILDMLEQMHRATTINLSDAALVTKDAEGKLQIKETREVTGKKGFKRGAIAAGVFGLIFPPSLIASAIAGGVVGGAWGKLRDTGIKSSSMNELGEKLEAGKAAVVALVDQESVAATERAMQGYDGELVKHEFSASESAGIEEAAAASGGEGSGSA
jgi:uncharacterized membrane protein